MATSGSTDLTTTRNELIQDALILINAVGIQESVGGADLAYANRQLNRMIKTWQADGVFPWLEEQGVLVLTPGTEKYSLGLSETTRAAKASDFIRTTVSAASSSTTLTLTSTTGMAAADKIGIAHSTSSIQWTTIASVDSSTQVTLDDALTSTVPIGKTVFSYTTTLERPLRIMDMRREINAGQEIIVEEGSREYYFGIVQKDLTGVPSVWYYNARTRDAGDLYVWLTGSSVTDTLNFTYIRSIEDFDNPTDSPDFPVEWYDALVYNLAVRIAPSFGSLPNSMNEITAMATYLYSQIKSNGGESSTVDFTPYYGEDYV